MKNISITGSNRKQISKTVLLGNGVRKQFTTLRQAGYFYANTNRFLTKCLVVANDTLAQIYSEYRRMWFVTTNTHHGKQVNDFTVQVRIRGHLQAAEQVLDKFSFSTWGSNDPYMAFIDLQKAAMFMKSAADDMADYHKKKNATAQMYGCVMLSDRCESLMLKLRSYEG